MTISNDRDLAKAYDVLGNLFRALAALRTELSESHPEAFALAAEGPLHEMRKVRAEIDEYIGVAQVESKEATIWLRLAGEGARWRETRASVLTAFLDGFRKGFQAVALYNESHRLQGRPTVALQRACDFEIVAFEPGSVRIGLRQPAPGQLALFDDLSLGYAGTALGEFLVTAKWVASDEKAESLRSIFPDATKLRVLLRAVKPIVPRTGGGIDFLEISASNVGLAQHIVLKQGAAARVTVALGQALAAKEERHIGDIREMDLDRKSFKLRNVQNVGEIACKLVDDLGSLASTYLGKHVQVIGTRADSARTLDVVDVERLEEPTES